MESNYNAHFAKYKTIINELDARCGELHDLHQQHTVCKKGCSQCCMNFSVLPVEFYAILDAIKSNQSVHLNHNEGCLFLINNACAIYHYRPSICRSHGLPILTMDQTGEQWELSFCPLNFEQTDDDYFSLDNSFQQDVFNSKLYLANHEFVKNYTEIKYSENELIDLQKMKEFLIK